MKCNLAAALAIGRVMRHIIYKASDPVPELRRFAGKQKAPQSSFLAAHHLRRIGGSQYFSEILAAAQPGTDSGEIAEIIDNIAEVHSSDKHLAALG